MANTRQLLDRRRRPQLRLRRPIPTAHTQRHIRQRMRKHQGPITRLQERTNMDGITRTTTRRVRVLRQEVMSPRQHRLPLLERPLRTPRREHPPHLLLIHLGKVLRLPQPVVRQVVGRGNK